MQTADCKEWDAQCKVLSKVSLAFGNACPKADETQARAQRDIENEIATWKQKNLPIAVMDTAVACTRDIPSKAIKDYHEAFRKTLMGKVSLPHILIMVSNA